MATNNSTKNFIMTAIDDQIQREAGRLFDEKKKQMIEEFTAQLEEQRKDIVARTAVRITRAFDISSYGDKVTVSFTQF